MRALYSLGIFFYSIVIRIASLFHTKARLWVRGRKDLFPELESKIKSSTQPVAWFHCASLGEFEQGRPLIEEFKKRNPSYRILLSFFSPSGFEVRKNYPGADIICYLPLDTTANAKRFISLVNPSIVFFVKYEFWLNTLAEIRKKKVPHFLVSGIFREDQIFFKSHGGIFREALKGFSFLFTQEKNSAELLKTIGITNVIAAGDTRFDRVVAIASGAKEIAIAEKFSLNQKVIVAGSTWKADEDVLFPAIKKHFAEGWKLLIAPHEISPSRIKQLELDLTIAGVDILAIRRYSELLDSPDNFDTDVFADVLIIDNIGMLSSLYGYGNIAYIGGGFGKSIHNTLEAAVYGIPVVFGPRFEKFNEAKELIAAGGGFGVQTGQELQTVLNELLSDKMKREDAGMKAGKFVKENTGATTIILEKTESFLVVKHPR